MVVLAGKGNNGGRGICAARHLANHGAYVKLVLDNTLDYSEVLSFQSKICKNTCGKIHALEKLVDLKADVILDSIIGYYLKGSPRGSSLDMIKWANSQNSIIISLDIPSGVDSNNGEAPGEFIRSYATLTLALPEKGLREQTCRLFLGDIGIPKEVYKKLNITYNNPFSNSYLVEL